MISGKVVPLAMRVLIARTSFIRREGVLLVVTVAVLVGTANATAGQKSAVTNRPSRLFGRQRRNFIMR